MTKPPAMAPSWLLRTGAWLAFVVPVVIASSRLEAAPRWDEDVAVARALGGVAVGAEGILSSALASLSILLPVGSRLARAALISIVAGGFCSWLLYHCARRTFCGSRDATVADTLLALGAALLTALTPTFQTESVRVGGATVAMLLVLSMLVLARRRESSPVALGVLFGLLVTESRWAAAAGAAIVLASTLGGSERRSIRWFGRALVSSLLTVAVALAPSLLPRNAHRAGLDLGLSLGLPFGIDEISPLRTLSEIGVFLGAIALLGVLAGLPRKRSRGWVLSWLALIGIALVAPSSGARLCALAGVAQLAALGLWHLAALLRHLRVPFRTSVHRLVVVLGGCVLLLIAEDGHQEVARRNVTATRVWTMEAFGRLVPGTMVISDSPEIAWRLWAARATEGTRPDVTLVPSPLLGHGSVARELLGVEPQIAGLIRDYAITGSASELSLSQLADARPLKVELDYDWDRRLLSYLTPDGLWSDVAPHALGRSDRKSRYESVRRTFSRIVREANGVHGTDQRTLDRAARDLYHHALVSAALGDERLAGRILDRLLRLKPEDPELVALQEKLDEHRRGAASVRALLR